MDWILGIKDSTKEKFCPLVDHLLKFLNIREKDLIEQATQIQIIHDPSKTGYVKGYANGDQSRPVLESVNACVFVDCVKLHGDVYKHMLYYNKGHITDDVVQFLSMLVDVETAATMNQPIRQCQDKVINPLHLVLRSCSGNIVQATQVLLKRPFSLMLPSDRNFYPVHYACGLKFEDKSWNITPERLSALQLLLLEKDLDLNVCGGYYQCTPLQCACAATVSDGVYANEAVSLLLENGADADLRGKYNMSALHYACGRDREGQLRDLTLPSTSTVIENLVAAGAKVNGVDEKYGRSALHYLMMTDVGATKATETLLQCGADPNLQDSEGQSPLHYICDKCSSAERNRERMLQKIQVLIKSGANVNILNNQFRTPLHLAMNCRVPKVIDLLLQAGADCNVYDIDGRKPTDLVRAGTTGWCIIQDHMSRQQKVGIESEAKQPSNLKLNGAERDFYKACRVASVGLGYDWKMVVRSLEPHENPRETESVIRDIESQHRGIQEQAYQALLEWKEKKGSGANIDVLIEALHHCHLVAVAEDVENSVAKCQSSK